MENRGTLNWNPSSSTSYTVPEGYYSGGTLSTANAYNTGYNAGYNTGPLKNMQSGTVGTYSITAWPDGYFIKYITFPTAFSTTPKVMVNCTGSAEVCVAPYFVTTTGFQLYCMNYNASVNTFSVDWIAYNE